MRTHWTELAKVRDIQIKSGLDLTYNEVFIPVCNQLLRGVIKYEDQSILDVGCGGGHLMRSVSGWHSRVDGVEPDDGMFEVLLENVSELTKSNVYHCAVNEFETDLLYDVVIANMVMHDVEDISDFLVRVASLITKEGHFVFSLPHPCFYMLYHNKELSGLNYHLDGVYDLDFYISGDHRVIGRTKYFHRSMERYWNLLTNSGLCIVEVHEPMPSQKLQNMYPQPWSYPRYIFFVAQKITHD
ncbi:MAG: class I SAM-dependent methyltransferase [Mariprofundus sp.]|nr:class I SAM-dependent methyltransferase [Mariprofundus sp.]